MALRTSETFEIKGAILYLVFFYIWLPFLVYSYGLRRAIFLVVFPFLGFPIAAVLSYYQNGSWADTNGTLIGMVFVIVLRALIGFALAAHSHSWKRAAQVKRGWISVGSCSSRSADAAIKVFVPPAPPQELNQLFNRLRSLFARGGG